MPLSDRQVAALAEERWGRWNAAIRRRDPIALGALELVLDDMAVVSLTPPSEQELEVLRLFAEGARSEAAAGAKLGISAGAVKSRLASVRKKLEAKNTTEAVAMVIREGLI